MNGIVEKLKDNPYFLELQQHILDKINELNSIDGLDGLTNEQAGEEVRARGKAIEKLEAILQPFLEFSEKREPTDEEIRRKKDQFGL